MSIGTTKSLSLNYEQALERVPEALKAEGFGVLTRIDMQATLKEKLGVDFRRYTILGACNPPLAHRALTADPAFGVLMPCNVLVYEEANGKATVTAVDPNQTVAAQSPAMASLVQEIGAKLGRVLAALS